jgi:alginate O-acetyltransferase complex protein AlgI
MSFVSVSYLILLLFSLLVRSIARNWKNKDFYLWFLLGASLVFYASYIPRYLFLLLGLTAIDFYMGRKIAQTANPRAKKLYLAFSILSNLGILGFYKYSHFLLESLMDLSYVLDHPVLSKIQANLALPLGISFFTFQSMSYTIDIYRGVIPPERRYWRFLLFVSFFTHLVSGPIVRARELLYQFDRKRGLWLPVALEGVYLVIRGFFLKRVVADNLAGYVNNYWNDDFIPNCHSSAALLLAFFFGCQIFADFEGYTSIARGSAYLLGFRLPVNFNNPYLATSFREFWTRWHITLSRWMRDYLYIPLGGNQVSKPRLYVNLLITMLLAGLWHGASWTFVVWGGLHGTAMVVERALGLHQPGKRPPWLAGIWFLLVQALVLVAWIYFRSEYVYQAQALIQNVFSGHWDWERGGKLAAGLAFTLPVIALHGRGFLVERKQMGPPGFLEKAAWGALMLYAVFSLAGGNNAFIYFHF